MSVNDSDSARLTSQGPGLLTALRRHVVLVLVCIVVAAALGVLVTYLLPTHYSADAQLVLGDQNNATVFRTTQNLNATAKAQNAAQVARSKAVHDRASKILKGRLSSDDVSGSVTASPGQTGNPLVTISATEDSAGLARDAANAVGRAYLDVTRRQAQSRGQDAVAALEAPLADLKAQLKSLNDQAAVRANALQKQASKITNPSDRARYVQSALDADPAYQSVRSQASDLTTNIAAINQKIQQTRIDNSLQSRTSADTLYSASKPDDPRSADLKRNAAIAAAIGLLIGAALAWRRLDRDRGVDHEQVADVLGAPLLATLGREKDLRNPTRVVDLTPGRRLPDDLRALASTLLLHVRRRGLSGFVVTSAESGEGRTALSVNLAAAAHAGGQEVVLVDGDLRNATLTQAYGLDGAPGLVDLLVGNGIGDSLAQVSYGGDRSLPLIPTGDRTTSPRSGLPALRDAGGTTPMAVVDSPALAADSVALLLASGGAGLLVLVSRAATLDELRTLRSRAALVDAPILGFVTTDHRPARKRGRAKPARHGQRVAESPATLSRHDAAAVPGR